MKKNFLKKLCKSKIFLSFSYAEGFGMPPIEAAIAGNKIIGYTGGGGKEYWKKPIFHEIQSGDIKDFSEAILSSVKNFPNNWCTQTSQQRKRIISKYSEENEKKLINKLINKISSYY